MASSLRTGLNLANRNGNANWNDLVEKGERDKRGPDQQRHFGHDVERVRVPGLGVPSIPNPFRRDQRNDVDPHEQDWYIQDDDTSKVESSTLILTLLTITLVVPNVLFLIGFTFSPYVLAGLNTALSLSITATLLCDEEGSTAQEKSNRVKKWIGIAFLITSLAMNGGVFAGMLQKGAIYQLCLVGAATLAAITHSCFTSQTDRDNI